jgi:hypothetical protein
VKGGTAIIGNNIVNRVDYNNTANDPYYNHTKQALLNDEFEMEYIDIDNDESTFSSSSAELFLDNSQNKKIVYAGLYWAATYKYTSGSQNTNGKFGPEDPAREQFTSVKIKLPNQTEYTSVQGVTLFDGIEDKNYNYAAPYVVYADITNIIKALANITGVYTVANIRATQGALEGGVAAGWTLFFVFEDATMTEKSISTSDGFISSISTPSDVVFSIPQHTSLNSIQATVFGAALEGDNNQLGDKLFIGNQTTNTFTALSTPIRKEDNFFNSCITQGDQYLFNRFPDSKNTLGFDMFMTPIPSSFINSNSEELTCRFQSEGDQVFVFFSALQTEINPQNLEKESSTLVKTKKGQAIKFLPLNNDLLVDDTKTFSSINRLQKNNTINEVQDIYTINSATLSEGYYLLANIFKTEQKAQEFIYYVNSKKIQADFFVNPLNNYYYVYLAKVSTPDEAIELYTTKMNTSYKERLQMLFVNDGKPEIEPKEVPIQTLTIPNQPKGFYIVANVFAVNDNATNFIKQLTLKGLQLKTFTNTVTHFKYVYLKKFDTVDEAKKELEMLVSLNYTDKLWILSVNNSK